MKTTNFKTQYRKFRMLTARFFSYWFFILFATAGVAIAVMERFTKVLGAEHLETLMILVLAYAILVYLVTERAKVLDDIHENLQNAKAEVFPTRDSVYMAVPLIIARASADSGGVGGSSTPRCTASAESGSRNLPAPIPSSRCSTARSTGAWCRPGRGCGASTRSTTSRTRRGSTA